MAANTERVCLVRILSSEEGERGRKRRRDGSVNASIGVGSPARKSLLAERELFSRNQPSIGLPSKFLSQCTSARPRGGSVGHSSWLSQGGVGVGLKPGRTSQNSRVRRFYQALSKRAEAVPGPGSK